MNEEELKREAIRAIEAGFADQLFGIAFNCTAPIYWYGASGSDLDDPTNNGTVFFVDAGSGPFCVTAQHVRESRRPLNPVESHGSRLPHCFDTLVPHDNARSGSSRAPRTKKLGNSVM